MSTELCYLTTTEALDRFKTKTLSPVELLQALIDRAEKVEPQVNAFTYKYYDEALDLAREAEQRYATGNPRPLEGVPIAVKDEFMIKDKLTGYARRFAEIVQKVNIMDAFEAEMVAGEMWTQFSPVFDKYNLFICPTVGGKGVTADFDWDKDEVEINGHKVDPLLGWIMTYPFNILSRCPVLSLPTGQASNQVPTGMQLVGPTYEDIPVFQAASAYAAVAGHFISAANCPEL